MIKNLLPLLLLALLIGCTGSKGVPAPTFYLLRAQSGLAPGPQTPPVQVGIGPVSIADYLAQDGIVVNTQGTQVRPAQQHLWAEPLDSAIRLYLRDAVATQLGYWVSADTAERQSWKYRIDVRIDEWHGSMAGDVRLTAEWQIIEVATGKRLVQERFEQRGATTADGYDALVRAQTALLQALAVDIAGSMQFN